MKHARKIVMVFGTFDHFYPGHKNFLEQAGKKGDFLITVIARDDTVLRLKKRLPDHDERTRKTLIKHFHLINIVVLGNKYDKYSVIQKYRPDIICLGYDQNYFVPDLKNKIKEFILKTKIIRLKPFHPDKYKTSILKNA